MTNSEKYYNKKKNALEEGMLCNNLCSKTRDSFYTRFEKKKNILEQKSMDMGCGVMAFVANEKIISLWTACRRDSR